MKIIHLSHSGFAIEENNELLLFDAVTPFNDLENYKKTYVFSSHSHGDHFKLEVFERFYKDDNFFFIFSEDILDIVKDVGIRNLHIVKPYESKDIGDISIEVYGTTDLGNSYLVKLNDKVYFHSGDLNWWHWKNKMNDKQLAEEEKIFKKEIEILAENAIQIDYAFIPVDPRLEEYGYLAMDHFIKSLNPKHVMPMHSFGNYGYYDRLECKIDLRDTALINIASDNEVIVKGGK